MNASTRARLSLALREFIAARPWRHVRPDQLFGVRDAGAGRLACASIFGRQARGPGLQLALGEGGFELLGALREGRIEDEEFSRNSDILAAVTRPARVEKVPVVGAARLGRLGSWLLRACFKPRWEDFRVPAEEEAAFLSRALRAVARWAGPEAAEAFSAPEPLWPVLSLSGPWENLRLRETHETFSARAERRPPLLVLSEEVLSSLGSRPKAGTLVVRLFKDSPPDPETPYEFVAMYFLPGTIPVEINVLPADASVLGAGRRLAELLANPEFPVPRRLDTDSYPFLLHAGEALEKAGIEARYVEDLAPEGEVFLRLMEVLARAS